jgi:hypothetical protein
VVTTRLRAEQGKRVRDEGLAPWHVDLGDPEPIPRCHNIVHMMAAILSNSGRTALVQYHLGTTAWV